MVVCDQPSSLTGQPRSNQIWKDSPATAASAGSLVTCLYRDVIPFVIRKNTAFGRVRRLLFSIDLPQMLFCIRTAEAKPDIVPEGRRPLGRPHLRSRVKSRLCRISIEAGKCTTLCGKVCMFCEGYSACEGICLYGDMTIPRWAESDVD